jgi:hypothetical protein
MKNLNKIIVAILIMFVCLVLVSGLSPSPSAAAPPDSQSMTGLLPVQLEAAEGDLLFVVPPPAEFLLRRPASATFNVNYLNAGEKMWSGTINEVTCETFPTDARTAFEYATSIWGALLNSSVEIKIDACWGNTGSPANLGRGGGTTLHRGFSGALQSDTWYLAALANALAGTDLNGGTAEIQNAFNSNRSDWHLGTGSTTPSGKYNFATVVLHEIAHGLGFGGSMSYVAGVGSWGTLGSPYIYDRFTENGSSQSLINTTLFPNPSVALGNQLVSENLYFNGTNANAANGNNHVKLYAPSTWARGSSYAHLDEIFNGTVNALMTYSLNSAETNYNPGPVTIGIFKDMGWPTPAPGTNQLYLPLILR